MTTMTLPQSRASDRVMAPLLVACLSYAWLVLNAEIGWLRGAIVLVDLAVVAAPFVLVLRRVTGRPGFAETCVAAGIGLASLGGLGMVLRRLGLPDIAAEIVFLLATIVLLVLGRRNRPGTEETSIGDSEAAGIGTISPREAALGWRIAAIVALALPLSYVLFCAWIGGRGPFPAFMLSADLSSDLALIRSLIVSDQMPPVLLPFAGSAMGYHYGSLEATAHLIRLAGIPPHAALLYVALPVFWSGAAASCWLIARRLATGQQTTGQLTISQAASGSAFAAAAGVLAVSLFLSHDMLELATRTAKMIGLWLSGAPLDQKPFMKIGPTHASMAAGISMAWASFMLLAHWQQRAARWLIALAIGLMAVLDAFFFAATGLVLGIWSLRQAWRKRSPLPLVPAAVALILGLVLQRVTGSADGGYHISIAFFDNSYVNRFALGTLRHGSVLIAIIIFACLLPRLRAPAAQPTSSSPPMPVPANPTISLRQIALGIAIIALLLFAITNGTVMRYGGQTESNFNWYRWLFIVPGLLGIGAAAGMPTIIGQPARWPKYVLVLLLLLAIPLQLLRYPVTGLQTLAAPTLRGDETLDTGTLAEALSHIPVEGSLIVASDLRYPSTDAPDNAPIVSAIFGHQCYICIVWPNQHWAEEMTRRYAEVKLLQQNQWSPQLTDLAQQHHWTHLLVRKAGPHPQTIPLPLVYENQDYAVYRF